MDLSRFQLEYTSIHALLGLFVVIGTLVVVTGIIRLRSLPLSRRWMVMGCRLVLLALLLLIIGGAGWARRNDRLEVIVLQDVSRSTLYVPTTVPLRQRLRMWIAQVATRKPIDDSIGVVRFDERSYIDQMPSRTPDLASPLNEAPGVGTDVASAINTARALFARDTMHRLVLAWDGNATDGDLDTAITSAVAAHVPIDVVPLRYRLDNAVLMDKLVAPELKRENEPFNLDVLLRNTGDSAISGVLEIRDNLELIARQSIQLSAGANVIHVKIPPREAGLRRFHASFTAEAPVAGADPIRSAESFTLVRGTGRVLYVDAVEAGGGHVFLNALASEGILIRPEDHISPDHFPENGRALEAYDAIILNDIARGEGGMSVEQEQLLTSYVRDTGGGLVMMGGPHTFGAGGWIGSSLEKILPVDCSVPASRLLPVGALVVVLDHSGSMAEIVNGSTNTKQQIADEASVLALQTLSLQDYFGLVAFDTGLTWSVPLGPNRNPIASTRTVRDIGPAGGTDICPALEAAIDALAKLPFDSVAIRHIVLLTDGDSQRGDYPSILKRMNQAKITLSTVAVGDDADRQLLSALASAGHGRFYPVSDPRLLPRIFIKEASVLRRPLIEENAGGIPVHLKRSEGGLAQSLAQPEPVLGMVLTSRKPGPQVEVPMTAGPHADPLLASWPVGLGRVTIFASDASNRWASRWIGGSQFGSFWAEVIRSVQRAAQSTDAELHASLVGGVVHIELDALSADGSFPNSMTNTARVVGPDGHATAVRLTQTAPGVYTGDAEAKAPGQYVVEADYRSAIGSPQVLATGFNIDPASELRDLQSNEAALQKVAARTGGRVLTAFDPDADLFSRDGLSPSRSYIPLRDILLPLALATVLLDVAIRRFAWRNDRPPQESNHSRASAAGLFW